MSASNDYVLAQGLRDTRATMEGWQSQNWKVLRGWVLGAVAIALVLLGAVWVVASATIADPTPIHLPGVTQPASPSDVIPVLYRNSLVLAFHATACIAGFIAGASMPIAAQSRTGFSRWVHVQAGKLSIILVGAVTLFSLTTQAYVLGFQCSTMALQMGMSPGELILTVAPHAIPELAALFLPLAAWLLASRSGEWHKLLAATFVTVGIAIPVLIVCAFWEVYIWPHILIALSPIY